VVYPRGDPRLNEHSVCRDYPQNPYQAEILKALGAEPTTAGFDFTNALALVIYGMPKAPALSPPLSGPVIHPH
jgi:hypothetical protein